MPFPPTTGRHLDMTPAMLRTGPPPRPTFVAWGDVMSAFSSRRLLAAQRTGSRPPVALRPPRPAPQSAREGTVTAACPAWVRPGILFRMSMSPTRLRACIALPGWSLRELARRTSEDDGTVRQMGSGKRPVPNDLAAWLERVAGAWEPLSEDLREAARAMGCDRGKYVRRPRNFRLLSDAEAQQLERLAGFHRDNPNP